jgi:hypothetical protein
MLKTLLLSLCLLSSQMHALLACHHKQTDIHMFLRCPAGTMGPIPAEDMEKWLLHGVSPKQMGRAIHRPVLEATSADPASLLVCALLPGELERNMKPGASDVLQAPTLHCTAAFDYITSWAGWVCRSRSPSLPNIVGYAHHVWNAAQ